MNITPNEHKVLRQIAENFLGPNNGAPTCVEDCSTYSDCVADQHMVPNPIKGKALSGVVSSLVQKGLAHVSKYKKEEYIDLTEAGYEAWRSQTKTS